MEGFHWRPSGTLAAHVDRIWGWESSGGEELALPILLPGTGAEVFFHYRSPFVLRDHTGACRPAPTAHVVCARRRAVQLCRSRDVGFVAVRFRVGSIHRFVRVPPTELADSTLSAAELWGVEGRRVMELIAVSRTKRDRLEILVRFLEDLNGRGCGDDLVERAVRRTYYDCSSMLIASLAGSLGIGRRQLERRVRSITGQSLVEIRSASRFQKVMRELMLNPDADLLQTSLKHGYYDQSHFARACKRLQLPAPGALVSAARAVTHFYNPPTGPVASMS